MNGSCANCGLAFAVPPHNIQPYRDVRGGVVCSVTCFTVFTLRDASARAERATLDATFQQASAPAVRRDDDPDVKTSASEGATAMTRPEDPATKEASAPVEARPEKLAQEVPLPEGFREWAADYVEAMTMAHVPDDKSTLLFSDGSPAVNVGALRDWLATLPSGTHTAETAQQVDSDRADLLKRADRIAEQAREIVREALRVRDDNAWRVKDLNISLGMVAHELADARAQNSEVYKERNAVAVALVRLALLAGYRAGFGLDASMPEAERAAWPVLYVDLPTGQVSWHIPRAELPSGLPLYQGVWDGHTTEEKYARLAELVHWKKTDPDPWKAGT